MGRDGLGLGVGIGTRARSRAGGSRGSDGKRRDGENQEGASEPHQRIIPVARRFGYGTMRYRYQPIRKNAPMRGDRLAALVAVFIALLALPAAAGADGPIPQPLTPESASTADPSFHDTVIGGGGPRRHIHPAPAPPPGGTPPPHTPQPGRVVI